MVTHSDFQPNPILNLSVRRFKNDVTIALRLTAYYHPLNTRISLFYYFLYDTMVSKL